MIFNYLYYAFTLYIFMYQLVTGSAGCFSSSQIFGCQIKLDKTLLYQHFASKFNLMLTSVVTVGQHKFFYVALVLNNWQSILSLSNTSASTYKSESSGCVCINLLLSPLLIICIPNGFSVMINWQGN